MQRVNNDHLESSDKRGEHAVFSEAYVTRSTNRVRCRTYNCASSRPERQSRLNKHTVRVLSGKYYAESGQLYGRATALWNSRLQQQRQQRTSVRDDFSGRS